MVMIDYANISMQPETEQAPHAANCNCTRIKQQRETQKPPLVCHVRVCVCVVRVVVVIVIVIVMVMVTVTAQVPVT